MHTSRSFKSFLVRQQGSNGNIVDTVPKPVQFDESNDHYRCMCGCLHVKTGAFFILAVEVFIILIFLTNSSLVYIQQNTPNPNENSTAEYVFASFTTSMVAFGVAIIVLFLAFIGIAKSIAGLLIPHIVVQSISLICFLALLICGVVAICTDSALFYRLLHAAPFDDHPKNNSVALSSDTLARIYTTLAGYLIAFGLQIWFIIVINNCYKYFNERNSYMNYCLAYSTPMKTLNCRLSAAMLIFPFLEDAIRRWFRPQAYDDPVDRLNYFITATLLVFFSIMTSAKQYIGSPIQCWMPQEFRSSWESYAEDVCFIKNTFYIPINEGIPESFDERENAQIGYYQWVPICLALQAIMFFIPNYVWKTLHKQSGLDLDTVITEARSLRGMRPSQREAETDKLKEYVYDALAINDCRKMQANFMCLRFGRSLGSYVSMLYLFTKLLYVFNIFIQFYLMNTFLGSENSLWGVTAMKDLWYGNEIEDSSVFPRVTLCDFKVRRLANIHRYTVQCVLMINMFNEKIYLFLWFWFFFVAVSTCINFLYSCFCLIPSRRREANVNFLLKHVQSDETKRGFKSTIKRFVTNGLKPDGCLLLKFIEGHAGAIVAKDLCRKLFQDFAENELNKKSDGDNLIHPILRNSGKSIEAEPLMHDQDYVKQRMPSDLEEGNGKTY
uniref:Innexin n=1 Tax=Rhabditophanes sp. KR3021 TaxID=114890 RepID=A0AC35TPG7_9BILA